MCVERRWLAVGTIGAGGDEGMEDRLVDEPSLGRVGREVGQAALVDEAECILEGLHDVLDLACGCLRPAASLGALGLDSGLLGLQNLVGDLALVVELDELLLLSSEFPEPAGVTSGFAASDLGLGIDIVVKRLADRLLL